MEGQRFKMGDRVYHGIMGYGTVTKATYTTSHQSTYTCVKYDTYLGDSNDLCGATADLTPVPE